MQDPTLIRDLFQLKAYHEAALETINRRLAVMQRKPKVQAVSQKVVAQAIAKRKSKIIKP
jgi:hypothetical protein